MIRARNAIQMVNLMAAAFGTMEGSAAVDFGRELQMQSSLSGLPAQVAGAARPKSYEEMAALMAGSGQKIVVE